jgi:outer membrane protein assembly factor BamA
MFAEKRGSGRRIHARQAILLGLVWITGFAALSLAATPIHAAEGERPAASAVPAPPEFMRNKRRIPEFTLKEKREGWYFTGIPLIASDPDSGFTYGASIQWFENGSRDSPFFYFAPYRKRAAGTVNRTTRGTQEYYVEYDQPYIADTPWRVRAFGGYLANTFEPYYGVGERTLGHLGFPGTPGTTYGQASDYFDALREDRDGKTWARYNYYDKRQYLFTADLERDYLGGLLRPMVGIQISHLEIRDYTGVEVRGAINQETLLREDFRNGRLLGFDGGWHNLLRLGLTYDSRDYEPDPASGLLGQILLEGTTRWLGAGSDYGHVTLEGQGYARLFPDPTRLVLAANAAYSVHFGDAPFFAFPNLSVPSNELKQGLGGWHTLRGYHYKRFVGKVQMQANLELRWTLADVTIWNQNFRPMLVPFVDAGRVFDRADRFSLRDWKITGGLSVRFAWNLATIISFDYGFGREGSLFYMMLGHPF